MDANQGHFSKALAEWAISRMRIRDNKGNLVKLGAVSFEDAEKILKDHGIGISEECVYDAWYLYNMCLADYRRSLPERKDIAMYVDETINDPDCDPTAVLACFRAKMDTMRVPIHWERYL